MLLRPDNESAAEYLSNLELRITMTQKHNTFSKMNTDENYQIVQVKMNNILPKINAVMLDGKNFSEIIALPPITIGFWLKKVVKDETDFFEKIFGDNPDKTLTDPLLCQELEDGNDAYYYNILKDPDEKPENNSQLPDPVCEPPQPEENEIKTKFLFLNPTNLIINLSGKDPQVPMDFVNIKEQFMAIVNEHIEKFIFNSIQYHFPDIKPGDDFISLKTEEVFDEELEAPETGGNALY